MAASLLLAGVVHAAACSESGTAPAAGLGLADATLLGTTAEGVVAIRGTAGALRRSSRLSLQALSLDPRSGEVLGLEFADRPALFAVEPATGAVRVRLTFAEPMQPALAFDPAADVAWTVDLDGGLVETDLVTGASTKTPGLFPPARRPGAGQPPLPPGLQGAGLLGLAFSPDRGGLHALVDGGSTGTGLFLVSGGRLGGPGGQVVRGGERVAGLAWDARRGVFYTVRADGRLVSIAAATGFGTPLGIQGVQPVGLAYDVDADGVVDADLTVHPLGGGAPVVGDPPAFRALDAAAPDGDGGVYAVDRLSGQLLHLDRDGRLRYPKVLRGVSVAGLAFDPAERTLYAADQRSGDLLVVDTDSEDALAVGPVGFRLVEGLAFDPASRSLFGVDLDTFQLIRIDPRSGAGAPVAPIPGGRTLGGLTWDARTATLVGSDPRARELVRLDPVSGALLEAVPTSEPVQGLGGGPLD